MDIRGMLVIIPAYNEERNITHVIRELRTEFPNIDILVVDDGSEDKTARIVKEMGEKVISHPYNLGYGAALQTGFKYAVLYGTDRVVLFDGDGQHIAKEIIILTQVMEDEKSDIVIGSRFMKKGLYNPEFTRKAGILIYRWLALWLSGQQFMDPTSGMQVLNRKVIQYFAKRGNYPNDFPDVDVLIFMKMAGFKITEVSVDMRRREEGESMHGGLRTIYYVVKMFISIIAVYFRKKPNINEEAD